jgi:hypothetical protein
VVSTTHLDLEGTCRSCEERSIESGKYSGEQLGEFCEHIGESILGNIFEIWGRYLIALAANKVSISFSGLQKIKKKKTVSLDHPTMAFYIHMCK